MIVNRRTFAGMVTTAVAAPRLSFAQAKDRSAFYSGVSGRLTHYEVDFGAASFGQTRICQASTLCVAASVATVPVRIDK